METKKKFNLLSMQKKAQSGIGSNMNYLIGGLILIILITALAPEIYSNLATLTADVNVPGWVPTVLVVVVGAGLVVMAWKSFGNK